jgi:hypothetical protein
MRRAVAAVLVLCVLTGCSAVRAATGGDVPGPLVVVLFDVSRSTDDADVRARYLTTFQTVLDHVAATHGTVVGDVIDDDPLAHSTFPISATFEACDPLTQNRLVCDAGSARTRATAITAARDILARITGAAGTDIHDGLLLAQRVFDAYPEAGSRSLVLLSDMVERSARLNVARTRFDDASIAATIDGFAADGSIPDLRGVQVYVVGAGVSQGGSGMPADRFLAIQHFWQAYLSRAGASLPSERYGAALVRFP